MLATEKILEGGIGGKKPWWGAFALAVQASGQMVAGNARFRRVGLAAMSSLPVEGPRAARPRRPGTQSWSPMPPDCPGAVKTSQKVPKQNLQFLFFLLLSIPFMIL